MGFVGIWEFTWKIKKSQQKASSFSRQSNQMNPASDVLSFFKCARECVNHLYSFFIFWLIPVSRIERLWYHYEPLCFTIATNISFSLFIFSMLLLSVGTNSENISSNFSSASEISFFTCSNSLNICSKSTGSSWT